MSNLINFKKSTSLSEQNKIDPFSSIQRALTRAMDDFYNFPNSLHLTQEDFENIVISPSIDIVDDKDQIKVEAEMPGMGEEDVKVSLSEGMLHIKGEKRTSSKDKDKNYMRREIGYGCYERTIALPESVDYEKAKASFRKGMLWVTIPKKAEATRKNRELKIEKA